MYRKPANYESLFADLRAVIQLINVSDQVYGAAAARFERVLVFVARSYLYARAAETNPCFSLPQLASRGFAVARSIVAVRTGNAGFPGYQHLIVSLSDELGYVLKTPHRTIETAIRSADLSSNMVCRFISDLGANTEHSTKYTWLGK